MNTEFGLFQGSHCVAKVFGMWLKENLLPLATVAKPEKILALPQLYPLESSNIMAV